MTFNIRSAASVATPAKPRQPICLNPDCADRADTTLQSGYCRGCEDWKEEADPEFGIEYDA